MNIFDTLRYIEIETHSSCTRKCPWCLFGKYPDFRPRSTEFLDENVIIDIFTDLYNHSFRGMIGLFSINEPLLDPRIVNGSLIKKCKMIFDNHILISITTNGDLLTRELTKFLFSSGLDILKISCYSDDIYLKMKGLYNDNPRIYVLDQTRYLNGMYESNRGGVIPGSKGSILPYNSCLYPEYRAAIGWDGEIRICYNDVMQRMKIGNVKTSSLSSILESKSMSEIRRNIKYHRDSVIPCCECNVKGCEEKLIQLNEQILEQIRDD